MPDGDVNNNPALFLHHQGIGLCQKVVNFTNNPANGCTNTLPTDYCTSMNTAQDYGDTMDATVRRRVINGVMENRFFRSSSRHYER